MKKKFYLMLFLYVIIVCVFINYNTVLAANESQPCKGTYLQVSLPTMPKNSCLDLTTYVKGLYDSFLAIIGIIAAVMMMWGAFKWIVAAGSPEKIKGAQTTIFAGVSGLVLAIFSYMILYVVNPQLTVLKPINPEKVGNIPSSYLWCSEVKEVGDAASFMLVGTTDNSTKYTKSQTVCGKKYQYIVTDSNGQKATKECTGDALDDQGSPCQGSGKYCAEGNSTNPLAQGVFSCIDPEPRCTRLNSEKLMTTDENIMGLCNKYSISGKGLCEWAESSPSQVMRDYGERHQCNWRQALQCPSGTNRVPCEVCNQAHVDCSDLTGTLKNIATSLFGGGSVIKSECVSNSTEDVYLYDVSRSVRESVLDPTGARVVFYVKGICCQGGGGAQCINK